MEKFTMTTLYQASASPMCRPGSIAEFGSGEGQNVIAKYVKVAYYNSPYIRVGEPLFFFSSATQVTELDPYNIFLVTNDYSVTGYVHAAGISATAEASVVGCAPGGPPALFAPVSATNLPSLVNPATTPWMWAILRGPLRYARASTNTNSNDGVILKAIDVSDGTYHGTALAPAAATDVIIGVQRGASQTGDVANFPYKIHAFISMPRWW